VATFYILSAHPTTVHPVDTLCETFSPMCRGLYDFVRLYDERLAKGKNIHLESLMNSLGMLRSDDYSKVHDVYIGESYATGGQHMVRINETLNSIDILRTELRGVELIVYLSQYTDNQLYKTFTLLTDESIQHSSRANLIGIVYDIISFGISTLPVGIAQNLSMISIVDDQITSLTRSPNGWFNELEPSIMNKINFQSYMLGLSMPNVGRELRATYMAGRFVKGTTDLQELTGRLDLLALFYIFLTYYFSEGSDREVTLQILDRYDSLNDNKLDIPMFEVASGNVPILMMSKFVTFDRFARRVRMEISNHGSTSSSIDMLSIIMRLTNIPLPNMEQAIVGMSLPEYGPIITSVMPYHLQPIILSENEYNLGKYLERLALQRLLYHESTM
jgi:hypothetical protein